MQFCCSLCNGCTIYLSQGIEANYRAALQLDDAKARAIRYRELASDSKDLAFRETQRLPRAMERYQEAMQREFKFNGDSPDDAR